MLRPNAQDLKVYLHRAPIDMRRGRNGLAAIVREVMQQDPFQPAFFLFINKRFDALKLLTGLSLLGHMAKRKGLIFQEWQGKGLSYKGAVIFAAAAVIRGGDCGGRVQPSLPSNSR